MTPCIDKLKNNLYSSFFKLDSFFRRPILQKIFFGSIVLVSFLLIYVLNLLQPLFGDDWAYSMLPNSSVRIQNFGDILHTQYEHYFTWGGRTVVHIIAQTLLLLGSHTADILNSVAYVCLTLIIYFIVNQSNKIRPSLLIGINLLLWFFQPAFGSTILWITGSANYLWGTLIIICFLIPYIRLVYKSTENKSITKNILMLPLGVIAGWTNENMAVALIFMLIVLIVYFKLYVKKLPLWTVLGLVGVVIGCVFMISAPGNYVRMAAVLADAHTNQSSISLYAGRIIASIAAYYYYALGTTFIYILSIIVYKTYGVNDRKSVSFVSFLFFSGGIIATLAMSGSPIFPGRASFGINILLFIAIGTLYANLDFTKKIIQRLSSATVVFALLLFVTDYGRAYKILDVVDKHDAARLIVIEEGKQKGEKDFVLDDRTAMDSPFLHYYELTPDSTDWHNTTYSKYYGIQSIIVK